MPWREDHERRPIPRGALGWVDSAQAAMETEPAGAFPHCCFDNLFPLGYQRKSEQERHTKSEEGFCVWCWKKSNIWEFGASVICSLRIIISNRDWSWRYLHPVNLIQQEHVRSLTGIVQPFGKMHLPVFTFLPRAWWPVKTSGSTGPSQEIVIPPLVKKRPHNTNKQDITCTLLSFRGAGRLIFVS